MATRTDPALSGRRRVFAPRSLVVERAALFRALDAVCIAERGDPPHPVGDVLTTICTATNRLSRARGDGGDLDAALRLVGALEPAYRATRARGAETPLGAVVAALAVVGLSLPPERAARWALPDDEIRARGGPVASAQSVAAAVFGISVRTLAKARARAAPSKRPSSRWADFDVADGDRVRVALEVLGLVPEDVGEVGADVLRRLALRRSRHAASSLVDWATSEARRPGTVDVPLPRATRSRRTR